MLHIEHCMLYKTLHAANRTLHAVQDTACCTIHTAHDVSVQQGLLMWTRAVHCWPQYEVVYWHTGFNYNVSTLSSFNRSSLPYTYIEEISAIEFLKFYNEELFQRDLGELELESFKTVIGIFDNFIIQS